MTDEAVGARLIELLRAGRFDEIREMFPPNLRALVTAEAVRAAWDAEVSRNGEVTEFGAPVPEAGTVKIPVTFARGAATVVLGVSEGWLIGLQVAPAEAAQPVQPWEPPAYADPSALTEREVTVAGVPGTITTPLSPGPHPAVVLLAGSGPLDRDETIGRNKPFKDLAWGLATAGVASARFDKVTFARPGEVRQNPRFTVTDEYLPQALAALRLLQDDPAVGPVFLLGHSLGGTVAPRIAAAAPTVAGLIIFAGGWQPLHRSAVRQIRYLAALDPAAAAAQQEVISHITAQAETVDDPALSDATPFTSLPFGIPASYWLDLRGYDPAVAAAATGKPVLLLQGARDYQATVDDDLPGWRAGLPEATVHVYEADNHLFFAGSGPSRPAEYEPAQHVDPAVVADIVTWVRRHSS
jgi:dienelactone hydrolase